jgi:HEAT repeat protein
VASPAASAKPAEGVEAPPPTPPQPTLDEAQMKRLIEALASDDSFKVRLQAAVLLGRSKSPDAVKPLIDALNNDPHYTVRAAAATALANLGEPRAISHILKRVASDSEAFVREEATRALSKFARADALPFVVATYGSPDARVRQNALEYLAAEPTALAEPVFARALGDDAPEVRAIALAAVQKMPPAELLRFLDGALDHREPAVRRGAIDMLQKIGTAEATTLILKVYERDIEEEDVRLAARDSLRQLKQFLPLDQIVKDATGHEDKHTRVRALRRLGVIGGDEANKVLLTALADEDAYVRGNAAMAMADLGDPSLVPSLEKAAEDPQNQRIVHIVRHALKQLRKKRDQN